MLSTRGVSRTRRAGLASIPAACQAVPLIIRYQTPKTMRDLSIPSQREPAEWMPTEAYILGICFHCQASAFLIARRIKGDCLAHLPKLTPSMKPSPPSGFTLGGQYTATKVAATRNRATGMTTNKAGGGAVFAEKCHQKLGLRVDMMFSCKRLQSLGLWNNCCNYSLDLQLRLEFSKSFP